MSFYTQPEMVGKDWKASTPHDKPVSLRRGKRHSVQTKKVQAVVAKLKRMGW